MTDDRRRRDDERLRRAQEIASALREQQAQLAATRQHVAQRAQSEPVVLAQWRRANAGGARPPFPDDAG